MAKYYDLFQVIICNISVLITQQWFLEVFHSFIDKPNVNTA